MDKLCGLKSSSRLANCLELAYSLALPGNEVTKAEALRRAQLALLKNPRYKRPHFWAPYVLVGNWLPTLYRLLVGANKLLSFINFRIILSFASEKSIKEI